jgi:hypothetical protein
VIDKGDDIFLIDVREPNEYEIVSIPGATLIPKGEFLTATPWSSCRRTSRSCCTARAAPARRGAGRGQVGRVLGQPDAVHVGGGVLAWVNQIDPSRFLPVEYCQHHPRRGGGDRGY